MPFINDSTKCYVIKKLTFIAQEDYTGIIKQGLYDTSDMFYYFYNNIRATITKGQEIIIELPEPLAIEYGKQVTLELEKEDATPLLLAQGEKGTGEIYTKIEVEIHKVLTP